MQRDFHHSQGLGGHIQRDNVVFLFKMRFIAFGAINILAVLGYLAPFSAMRSS